MREGCDRHSEAVRDRSTIAPESVEAIASALRRVGANLYAVERSASMRLHSRAGSGGCHPPLDRRDRSAPGAYLWLAKLQGVSETR